MIIGKKTKKALQKEFIKSKSFARLTSGEIVQILREKNNYSQNDLAAKTNLTQATISSIENNRIHLGIERAKILAKALHVHPASLIFPDLFEKEAA